MQEYAIFNVFTNGIKTTMRLFFKKEITDILLKAFHLFSGKSSYEEKFSLFIIFKLSYMC